MYGYNPMQPVDPAYAQFAAPAGTYYPTQPMMVPVPPQPQYIIVTNPQAPPGAVYASPYFAHPQPIYYQDVNSQQSQQTSVSTDSSVRPLLTSTPLPSAAQTAAAVNHYARMRMDRGDRHVPSDILADISKISINDETVELSPTGFRAPRLPVRMPAVPSNYKTKICMNYANTGYCKMGTKCLFAHGFDDRRGPLPRNTRFKTRLCKHYEHMDLHSSNGSRGDGFDCPYGNRCEFIHPSDKEFRSLPPNIQTAVKNKLYRNGSRHNDVTPEQIADCPSLPSVTRSDVKSRYEKSLLPSRKVAGSMMCLASIGKGDGVPELSPPRRNHLRYAYPARSVMNLNTNKFDRRRSVSNQNMVAALHRCNSLEHLLNK